ncbi:hypothetical protein FRC08_016283 [Ceratobasidium sp. 394]|nr:hypothetical protein FRC08_016283 [Ceratobasidium sp. 394]
MATRVKPAPSKSKPTRAVSGPNPDAPADRTATPAPPEPTPAPVPTSPEAALAFFVGQNLLSSKKDPITAGTFVRLLEALAKYPNHPPIVAAHISALSVLAPSALDLGTIIFSIVKETRTEIDKLSGANKKILELVENPVGMGEDVGDKIDSMMSLVTGAATNAKATEQAAEESHKSLIAFVDAQAVRDEQGWSKVTAQNSRSHRDQPPPPRTETTEAQPPKPNAQKMPPQKPRNQKL